MIYDTTTKLLYVGHSGSNETTTGRIAVVNTRQNSLVEDLPVAVHPEALEIDPGGKRVFANIADSGEIAVINSETHSIIGVVETVSRQRQRTRDMIPMTMRCLWAAETTRLPGPK